MSIPKSKILKLDIFKSLGFNLIAEMGRGSNSDAKMQMTVLLQELWQMTCEVYSVSEIDRARRQKGPLFILHDLRFHY